MTNLLGRNLALLALSLAASLALAENYVLNNVRIVSPGRPVVERGMIIVSGDKIAHVGAPTAYESGFNVIDCTGLTAYPGFVDAYSRSALRLPDVPAAPEAPPANDGPLAAMWHENRRGVYADLDVSKHIDPAALAARHNQGVTTLMLASGRGAFGGLTCVVAAMQAEPANVLVARAFQELSFSGGGGGYPGSAMARIALMRQMFFDGRYYAANPPQDGDGKDAVIGAIGDAAIGTVRTLFRADSEREIQRALDLTDEFGLRMTLMGTSGAWQHAAELKQRNIGVVVEAALPREPNVAPNEDPVRRLSEAPQEYRDAQHKLWQDNCLAVVKLQAAGVKFAFTSDGDPGSLLENVRKHIALGLPADAALRALTIDAADILGVADKVGTIEVGKLASLVLMTADFTDADTKVKSVFVAGTKFDITTEEN